LHICNKPKKPNKNGIKNPRNSKLDDCRKQDLDRDDTQLESTCVHTGQQSSMRKSADTFDKAKDKGMGSHTLIGHAEGSEIISI